MTIAVGNIVEATGALTFSPVTTGEPFAIGPGFTALQFRHDQFAARAMSPFVMVDHFHMSEPTFDVHPHAGMSAVTLMFEDTEGTMASRDSVGHNAVFGAGDLHWTLAGRGILHTQVPVERTARLHALQIFVNLPARLKDLPPTSFHVRAGDMPEIRGTGFRLRVVAGELAGRKSPAMTPEPILMLDGVLDASADRVAIPLPANWNAWVYLVDGATSIDGVGDLAAGQVVCASAAGEAGPLACKTTSRAHFVVLAGPRIDEPVIQRGPFVFDSEASLARALADLHNGRFGQVADAR
ncbi:quercetin 2,3-dioxygenase [Aliidongia dinghuensis]|uniref:Quercetin 2,3-dioxygenase n=1 Tax=Aliidongia dinghuensis TaxID=1867774 RepID=A0A8J2YQB0_9PROT|nr:pirin family protein [Aliidongia dinghuensis]GGF04303.1 quercetin 2,3-dioxygenase [Aliidongia dinghuensis]